MQAKSIGAAVLGLALCACSSGPIHKPFDLASDNDDKRAAGLALDARQRAILSVDIKQSSSPLGQVKPRQVICAEPSPDVAVAMAEAFSLGLSGKLGAQESVAGALSRGSTESLAQLGQRTATVQLLRDLLYRACEAYANGALSASSYAVMLSGIDDFATTLFLSEAAAGGLGGTGVTIESGKITTQGNASVTMQMPAGSGGGSGGDGGSDGGDDSDSGSEDSGDGGDSGGNDNDNETRGTSSAQVAASTADAGSAASGDVAATQIAKIHKQFMDKKPLGSLVVACISAMDRRIIRQQNLSQFGFPGNLPTDILYPDPDNPGEYGGETTYVDEETGPETPLVKVCREKLSELAGAEVGPGEETDTDKQSTGADDQQLTEAVSKVQAAAQQVKTVVQSATEDRRADVCEHIMMAASLSKEEAIFTAALNECMSSLIPAGDAGG